MIKYLLKLYHFLGSLPFAISLISIAALTVIFGTILESWSGSHLYASQFTYGSPFFTILLFFFFANILISALRRWPFRLKHIPFLITHLGLLMVICGTIIKNIWGIQGHMMIVEGSASQTLLIPNTKAIAIENQMTRKEFDPHKGKSPFPDLELKLIGYAPNAIERYHTWFKGDLLAITGLPPFHVSTLRSPLDPPPVSGRARFAPAPAPAWNIIAVRSPDASLTAQEVYLSGLTATVSLDKKMIKKVSVKEAVKHLIPLSDSTLTTALEFNEHPRLHLTFSNPDQKESVTLPLSGEVCLIDVIGTSLYEIDLERDPTLLYVEEPGGTIYMYAFDSCGQIHRETFENGNLKSLVVYDQGYQGYAVQTQLPIGSFNRTRSQRERKILSSYLRVQGIETPEEKTDDSTITLETTLSPTYLDQTKALKLEDNSPRVTLQINRNERISLLYDRIGSGLKWPTRDGAYLLRFQPHLEEIPYRVRLREARQINYPHTNQPYSYEADIIISDLDHHELETTLSMNHVYETWDGYRFYLANISTPAHEGAKRIQLIVNHDPAKYLLTYPGACLVALGILLLFWGVPRRK